MFNIGPLELIVVLIIALIVLGPARLPDAARSVGRGIREFRGALNMDHDDEDDWEAPAPPREAAADESHKSGSPEAQAAAATTRPDAEPADARAAAEPPKPASS